MRLKTFLDKLRATPRNWRVHREGCIRNRDCQCPITAVLGLDGHDGGNDQAHTLIDDIGWPIMCAADGSVGREHLYQNLEDLRRLIKDACGL